MMVHFKVLVLVVMNLLSLSRILTFGELQLTMIMEIIYHFDLKNGKRHQIIENLLVLTTLGMMQI